jgi:class 3 adenylate cyclase/tetratricopeptide (TPR) repeat protein
VEGHVVGERYELLEVLGRASETQVVRAIDRQNDRVVALKVRNLAPDVSRDRILAEGRALLGLRPHPTIPTVRDGFFLDDESYVLVMDWVEGTPLGTFVAERGDPGLPLGTVLVGLSSVADALDHLHRHDPPVVHGDVRPENVLVGVGGRLSLVFGLGGPGLDRGDDAFRAPEFGSTEPNRALDMFGLAATTVFALTGSPPAEGEPIAWDGIAPELAKRLDRIARRALDPDPSRRPPSAPDFVERMAAARESAVPAGVVTFAMTDVEGSTDLWELHPDVMARVMLRHQELAADIAEAHGGRMPRSQGEGDSTLTAFARATDALDATLEFQRAISREPWPAGIEIKVRAALHTGEAQVEHGDYFGTALSRAARLRALARGGQVLLSQATAELVADRLPPSTTLRDLGSFRLKGLERAEQIHQLCAPDLPELAPATALIDAAADRARLGLPITLESGNTAFVGRGDQLSTLRALWSHAVDTSRRVVVMLNGEPGIGKSRLAAEFAHEMYEGGATVLHGRCYEENVIPYQPLVESVGYFVRNSEASTVRSEILRSGTLLARLVPDIALLFPDLPEPVRAEPDSERYLMFESVNTMLSGMARSAPLLLVLDDLHWADRPTIALLCHVARSATAAPLMVLGTYRAGEVSGDHPLAIALSDLRHDRLSEEVALSGLDEGEVGELIGVNSTLNARPDFVKSVSRETAGNPFFVQEICSHVGESGAATDAFTLKTLGVPEGVKQVIGRRIARLPDGAARLLSMGAVIGRDFDLDVLIEVAGDDEDTALDLLDQACAAHLVMEVGGTFGRYSFRHALTREALYDSLGGARKARLHRRVAEAIELRRAAQLEDQLGTLAYHYAEAGTELVKAVEFARRAGDQALVRLAHEEAAAQFERGLGLLGAQDRSRCDLLLGLAEARRRSGDVAGSQQAFADAGAVARSLDDAERLARAAIGNFRGHVLASPGWHEPTITLLEEALDVLPDEDSVLRSRVLAALSLELYFTPETARAAARSADAIAMARRLENDEALAFALACGHTAVFDSGRLPERLAIATELIAVGARAEMPELALIGHVHRAVDLLELRRVDEARREADAAAAVVEELGQPMQRYFVIWLQSTLTLLEGRFDDADALTTEALDIGIAANHPDAFVVWGTQATVLAWQRGDTSHLLEPARQLLDQFPDLSAWPAAVALVEVMAGEPVTARERLRAYAADLDALEFGSIWTAAMLALTEVARITDDRESAGALYERLAPFAHTLCVVSLNLSEMGPVSRAVGVLATLVGDVEGAERYFEDAMAVSRHIGAPAHTARTSVDYARMLLERRKSGDIDRARTLLKDGLAVASDLGMAAVAADAEHLQSTL